MARPPRADEAGGIYHALNRGIARRKVFHKYSDYEAFERIVVEGLNRFPVALLAYQWMPNHWHMVLRPSENRGMGRLLHWITMTHSARHHAHYGTTGEGHLYQGRFKSFPVQDDGHFLVVCRYVERNALTAGLVSRAEHWRWGSLWNRRYRRGQIPLDSWPVTRPTGWSERVNRVTEGPSDKKLRRCVRRSSPFGDEAWVQETASRTNLQSTVRPIGRPPQFRADGRD